MTDAVQIAEAPSPARRRAGWLLAGIAVLALAGCADDEVRLPGERFSIDIPLAATLPTADGTVPGRGVLDPAAGDAPRAISLPAATTLGSWTARGFNSFNRVPHAALSGNLTNIWTADIGRGNTRRNRITADPVAADGRVFTMDSTAGVVATSLSTGGALWGADLQADFDRGGSVSGGGLALGGGRLYASTGFGELIALDPASGAILWRQRLDAGIGAPTYSNGRVYIVSRNNQAWGIDAANGRIDFQIPALDGESVLTGGAAPAVGNGLIVFPFGSGELMGVSQSTATQRWSITVAGSRGGFAYAAINDITGDPVIAGGRIYAGNQSGRVVALDPALGGRIWTAEEGAYSPVLVTGSDLFFVSDRNELIRLSASDGDRIWGAPLPLYVNDRERRRRAVFTHYGPILAGGQLLLASGDGNVRLFSPQSGELVGVVELRDGAAAHPIVVNDILLVVTEGGRLQAFR